jgi:uncharacterized protein Yka (UPF0111/DUF47 family)
MVFPVESEDRTMRNLLMLFQDEARITVESFRKVLVIIDELMKNNVNLKGEPLNEINASIKDSSRIKNNLIEELRSGGIISGREHFFRLMSIFGDIMDHIEFAGIRLFEIGKKDWKIPEDVGVGILNMADHTFKTLNLLREAIISLSFDSQKVIHYTEMIDDIERKLDKEYFKVELTIISSNLSIPFVFLLRDITKLFEHMVDSIRNASDLLRIIGI